MSAHTQELSFTQPQDGRGTGSVLYCGGDGEMVRTSGRYLCLFAVMTSSQVTVRMGRPGELLLCWRLLALASVTR